MSYPFLIQGDNIVVVIGSKSHTINKTHIVYEKVKEAIKSGDWDSLPDLVEPKTVVHKYAAGYVRIEGDQFYWQGQPMNNALSNKMVQMLKEGFPIEPLVRFTENLMENPSKRAVDELYGFLEKGELPITPDGYFLAYKRVREDYTDCHTGTIDNSIGKIVEMPRNQVDDDKDRTCSTGLHFCSLSYLSHFSGARTVILKINPRDVVSIPSDYNDAKGRACRYEVIGEVDNGQPEKAFDKSVDTTYTKPAPTVTVGPTLGSSEFYKGYTAGFQGIYNAKDDSEDPVAYGQGYSKGVFDSRTGVERYRYIGATNHGRQLSMTKDAIRKRLARAQAKQARIDAGRVVTTTPERTKVTAAPWPYPKA